jgi:hypothetical protein
MHVVCPARFLYCVNPIKPAEQIKLPLTDLLFFYAFSVIVSSQIGDIT